MEKKQRQAVILAGGLGTRLRPLTREIPKAMVFVAGAPYLEHQLRLLKRQDITDVVLLTGYLGEQIESHFGDGSQLGIQIRYSREAQPLGTGGALRHADKLLDDLFLLIYGDSFLPIEYAQILEIFDDPRIEGAMAVYDNRLEDTSVQNNIAIDENRVVVRYDKNAGSNAGLDYVEAGVLAFRKKVVRRIPCAENVSLENEIFPKLISQRELGAYITNRRFYDIGTAARLQILENFLSHDYYAHTLSD